MHCDLSARGRCGFFFFNAPVACGVSLGPLQQIPIFPAAGGSDQLGVALKQHPLPWEGSCEDMGCCKHRGGSRSSPSLPCAGEEEDGDEDDEAEGATGKRAAEDDEVGRAPLVS